LTDKNYTANKQN